MAGLIAGEHKLLSVRKPLEPDMVQTIGRERSGFSHASGEHHYRRRYDIGVRRRPLAIGRERESRSVAETNGGRSVCVSKIDRVFWSAAFSSFREKQRTAILRQGTWHGPIQPR